MQFTKPIKDINPSKYNQVNVSTYLASRCRFPLDFNLKQNM